MNESSEPTASPDATSGSAPNRRRPSPRLLGGGAVGLLVVALAAGLTVTSVRLHGADATKARVRAAEAVDSARISSLAAAKLYAVDLASYNYKTLDQGFANVTAHSTSSFTKTFEKSSAVLKPVLTQYKAQAKASVVAAGLTTCTARQAVAVVLLNQTLTNSKQTKGPTTEESKLSITLVQGHGQWMIEQVQLL